MKAVIILRGAPGSGKSSLARLFSRLGGPGFVAVVSADDYMTQGGTYCWTPERLFAAHAQCQAAFERALAVQMPVIVIDNTNTEPKNFTKYLAQAVAAGYTSHVLVVENRHGGNNVHGCPVEAVARHRQRIIGSICP